MAIYLLDFENVHDSGITGVTSLTENDELYIFYSVKSEHMSFDTHVNIMKTAAKVRYIKLRRAAKNYLDFQLCTHLGYIIGAGFEGPFYIISKDTGYDSAIDYWKDHGVTIIRQPSIGFNRSLGKSTGQNPAHNTPPAQVTFKEGNQVITPDVSVLYRMDTGKLPSDADIETAAQELAEDAAFINSPEEDQDTAAADPAETESPESESAEPVADTRTETASDEAAEQPASGGRNTRQSRSRKSSSKKSAAKTREDVADKEEAVPAAEAPDTADEGKAVKEQGKPAGSDSIQEPESGSEENAGQATAKPDSLPESFRKRVRTALKGKGIPSAYYASIYKAILNSYDKLALNNLLVKTFGSSKGGEVYKLLKDIFMDFQS